MICWSVPAVVEMLGSSIIGLGWSQVTKCNFQKHCVSLATCTGLFNCFLNGLYIGFFKSVLIAILLHVIIVQTKNI